MLIQLTYLIHSVSLKKLLNAFQVFVSYFLSSHFKSVRLNALPFALSVEPTTSCNLRCPECPSGLRSFTRPTGMLNESLYKKIIDELSDTLIYLNFYFQGEPFLHPQLLDLVSYASRKKIYTSTSTNAHYLNAETAQKTVASGLKRIIISIDGTTQETYQQYRIGGQLEKVISGTKELVKWKKKLNSKTPHIVFQFLVVKPNEHQVDEIKKMAKELEVDEVSFKTAQLYEYEKGHELMPENEKFSRYKKVENNQFVLKNKLENHCWKMWHSAVITWDGAVVPCCFDKDAKHKLGSVKDKSFREVWFSEKYFQFRKSVLQSRKNIDICTNCSEGSLIHL